MVKLNWLDLTIIFIISEYCVCVCICVCVCTCTCTCVCVRVCVSEHIMRFLYGTGLVTTMQRHKKTLGKTNSRGK